jgi:hypothetical protein
MTDQVMDTIEVVDETIEKSATIRGEGVRACPFSLPIPEACENAGKSVNRMAPTPEDEKAEKIAKANRLVYTYHKDCTHCMFADKVLTNNKKVDCSFGDTAAGKKSTPFTGSPLYPQTFGSGYEALNSRTLGLYSDNNESRNMFFGLFSLLGSTTVEEIIKLAEEYDRCGEKDKAEIVDNLLKKLQAIKDEYKDTFEKVEKYLADYRLQYEAESNDTSLIWELSDSWFGPRQLNRG